MEFKITKREKLAKKHYIPEDLELAYKFSELLYKELGDLCKGIILFGATAKKERHVGGDIDILIVLDDVGITLTQEIMETYKIIVMKTVQKTSPKIHITTLRLTTFWEYVKAGDPVGINILRDGLALVDTGFFDPLQLMLYQGRIRPTAESIWVYFTRAPQTLLNSRWHLLQATVDLYWAVIDSAHAALMKSGQIPPSPGHVADLIETKLVGQKHIEKKHAITMRKFYDLSKAIIHRQIGDITGSEYEKLYTEAKEFVDSMRKFIEDKEGLKKRN